MPRYAAWLGVMMFCNKNDLFSQQVGEEYSRLVQTLRNGGLQATGKKGDKQGRLIVPIHCPEQKVADLARDDA